MREYVFRRIVYALSLVFISASLLFFLIYSLPGSPFDRMRKEMADRNPLLVAKIPQSHWDRLDSIVGLDKPLHERYFAWLQGALTGDFGYSWSVSIGESVVAVVASRLPYTLLLTLLSVAISILIAVPAGIYSAVYKYSEGDFLITILSYLGIAMPSFWFGLLLMSIFSGMLGWLPHSGVSNPGMPGNIIEALSRILTFGSTYPKLAGQEFKVIGDGLKHMLMPAVTLSVFLTARWSRFVRIAMLEVLHQDYTRTARAKGLTTLAVILKHALPNALIPVVTVIALDIPMMFTGSFMTEIVFSWPGIGKLYIDSFKQNDWPVLQGLLVIYAYLIIFTNLITDLIYPLLNPRIAYDSSRSG